MRQVKTDGTGSRTFADDDVELKIFHGGIKNLLDDTAKAMNLVDKEDVAVLEVGKDGSEVAGAFDGGAAGDLEVGGEFVSDDVCHGGFSETGRAIEKNVVKSRAVVSGFDGIDSELEIGFEAFLTDIFGKSSRAEGFF